jgi:hypothetical protein
MKVVAAISLLFLCTLGGIAYGVAIGKYRVWPYQEIRLVGQEIGFLVSDLRGGLDRQLVRSTSATRHDFRPVEVAPDTVAFGKSVPTVSLSAPLDGLTAILGSFDFQGFAHGALLLDSEGRLLHAWRIHEDSVADPRGDTHKFPHGFVVLPDASIIFSYDGGVSLQRFGACGEVLWTLEGRYHHLLSLDESTSSVWAMITPEPDDREGEDAALRHGIQRIAVADGSIERAFTVRDIIEANPQTDVLGLRQLEETEDGYSWDSDPLHHNDVEPLPSALAELFPMFDAGDLLISFRSIDLVLVLDPETLRIKWYSIGQTRRQHDPDWGRDGRISVFDNNMHRGWSRIVRLDPGADRAADTALAGEDYDFYTWIRGNHQVTPSGSTLVTSPQQGRVFEVDEDGEVVFEFINRYADSNDQRFSVSNAVRLPRDYFQEGAFDRCTERS